MADISDVKKLLADTAAAALYPNGTTQPSAPGVDCRVLQGWPVPDDLNADMGAGKVQVSVYPLPGMDRNTTRFPKIWQTLTVNAATLTATVSGDTLTIGGTVSTPQVVMVRYNGAYFAYDVLSTDTLDTIAAGIAALITGATVVGAVVTVPNAWDLVGRIVTSGTAIMELRRQTRVFKITVWAPTQTLRDSASKVIDTAFAQIERVDMPDGSSARVIYRGTLESDENQTRRIYRRDLNYEIEYATTITETETTIGAIQADVTDTGGALTQTFNI